MLRVTFLDASTRQFADIMSDIHNAAVLLMTLPEEEASELMSKLDPKQVEQVSIEIARTRAIAADEQERVIKEFTEANPSMGGRGGGLELAKSLIQKALGTNAAAALVEHSPVDRGHAVRLPAERR